MRRVLLLVAGLWALLLVTIYGAKLTLPLDVLALVGSIDGQSSNIYLADTHGRLANLTRNTASEFSAVWSPDGSQLAFVRQQSDRMVCLLDWPTLEITILDNSSSSLDPTWSPDGNQLAYMFTPSQGTQTEIFTHDMTTGEIRNLTESGDRLVYSGTRPVWSPRGDNLLYINRLTRRAVVAALPYGEVVLQTPPDVESPVWSPSGDAIAYLSAQDRITPNLIDTIVIQSVDTPGDVQRVTPHVVDRVRMLAWSPDGRYLAFTGTIPNQPSFRNQYGFSLRYERVFTADLHTGDITPVAAAEGFVWDGSLTWSPDTSQLAFTLETPTATNLCFARVASGQHRCYAGITANEIDWRPQS